MDFAPYQSSPPEHSRPFSPPRPDATSSPRTSWDRVRRSFSPQQQPASASPPPLHHPQPQRAWSGDGIRSPPGMGGYQSPFPPSGIVGASGGGGDFFGGFGSRDGIVSEFDTSLGLRLDYEACLAYLAFPPLGAIILLILERKSDYVRFHAWQSALLFTMMFIVHLLFSWSRFFTWLLFLGDIALIGILSVKAYRDVDTLDRFEVPILGPIASRILDDE
ncbi:hypothetical protein VTK73DRAFT_6866 [Phialemonium thermophilum]|uniref:Uncharacterized protein n=1 Tax=Phialemonium thermophilum TaxID=223376 RepID=A0ABR3XUM1_9PEZI